MLKLWGRRSSLNVQKVLWTLGEIGVAFERVDAGGPFGGLDTPAFRVLNPHGRIPVLEDGGGVVVWESNAIVRYLAARYSPGGLWPEDPGVRAGADQWMDWCATGLQPGFMDFFWSWYRTPESQRNPARNAALLANAHQLFATLGQAVGERRFLVGERLSMGDVTAGSLLFRYFSLDIERPRLPRLEAWYDSLRDREAYRAGIMIPFDELKGRLAF